MKPMKGCIYRLMGIFAVVLFFQYFVMGAISYAAPPEGKGKGSDDSNSQGKALGQEKNEPRSERTTPASESNADRGVSRSERAQEVQRDSPSASRQADRNEPKAERSEPSRGRPEEAKIDRLHEHLGRKNIEVSDQGNSTKEAKDSIKLSKAFSHGAYGLTGERPEHGKDVAHGHLKELLKSLNKFEHARWNYNPNDTRGQGNMGKVDMRDPYGFDKDSGREGSERGRAIQEEPTLNLADLVTVDFQIPDYQLWYYQYWLKWAQTLYDRYSYLAQFNSSYALKVDYFAEQVTYYEELIAAYYSQPPPYVKVATNLDMYLNYTLDLGTQEGSDGTTLLVTTTLTSINDYLSKSGYWTYDYATGTWKVEYITYDVGETVMTQTQEVTMGEDSIYNFTYDPPNELVGSSWWDGGYFELTVTVTEPESGATYTVAYDRDIYLYRCPYGVVYDKKTGKPIAGATVTVHNVDGSTVMLDKASNPNASNPQITDATGRYNCKLAIGKKYYLSVKTPGYETYKSSVFSERWHVVREDVGLVPLSHFAAE